MYSSLATGSEVQDDFYITTDERPGQSVLAEDISWYRPGEYHPVHLGDLLGPDGRYRVVDKLGGGACGIVWLCHDKLDLRWRAVKINAARASHGENDRELKARNKLLDSIGLGTADGPRKILQDHGITIPVNHFTIQGPNGTHLALVYPLLGITLNQVFRHNAPQTELLKDICFQLVQAMQFLHRNGVCHGDFRPANILFQLAEGVDQWPEEQILNVLGQPKTERVVMRSYDNLDIYPAPTNPSRPEYVVGQKYFDYTSGLLSSSVAITDLGLSFFANDPPQYSAIPPHWAAPEEVIYGAASLGFASDVWALMNTILSVRLGTSVMVDEMEGDVLWCCEMAIGPMPRNYRALWEQMGGDFPNGSPDDPSVPAVVDLGCQPEFAKVCGRDSLKRNLMSACSTVLDQALWDAIASQDYKSTGLIPRLPYKSKNIVLSDNVRYRLTDTVELEQLCDLCMSVFKWQPEERALTGEILRHPWFGDRNNNNHQDAGVPTREVKDVEEASKNKWADKGTKISEKGTYENPGAVVDGKTNEVDDHLEGAEKGGGFSTDQRPIEEKELRLHREVSYHHHEPIRGVQLSDEDDDRMHYCYGDDDEVNWTKSPDDEGRIK
ncbi:Protein kinase-like domain containing protein [Naviculisporaceae sp. PSN 640]